MLPFDVTILLWLLFDIIIKMSISNKDVKCIQMVYNSIAEGFFCILGKNMSDFFCSSINYYLSFNFRPLFLD